MIAAQLHLVLLVGMAATGASTRNAAITTRNVATSNT